ncbi:MAG TPA: response regulator transcription factor [Tenuifilaceae bacterium]|nr:response regulator transcription factor [Tenuifilaceae bacterium]HQB76770.1 response regulator transcription factor [Tenuifilaceae bacterium]
METAKILIVEDEPKVANFIKKGLDELTFAVDVVYDGIAGRDRALTGSFDVIILDVNLPGINGFEICKQLRDRSILTPVLMLTALGSTDDKLAGFDSGADDYLVKPFEFRELVARVRALIKRVQVAKRPQNIITVANLEINTDAKTVKRNDTLIELTAKEFNLLEYLVKNQGRVVSRAEISEHIWDINFDTGTNIIDVYVNFLRKKIDRDFTPKLIHTVIGMGYILKEGDE